MAKLPTQTFVASLVAWANELGLEPRYLRGRLRERGIDTSTGQGLRAQEVFRAISAVAELEEQLLQEEIRYKREAANVKERQRRKLDGELVPAGEVAMAWESAVIAARQIIWQSELSESARRKILKTLSEINVGGTAPPDESDTETAAEAEPEENDDERSDDDAVGDDAENAPAVD